MFGFVFIFTHLLFSSKTECCMKSLVFMVIALLFSVSMFGQLNKTHREPRPYDKNIWKEPIYKKAKYILGLDSRFSVVEKNSTNFYGLRTGVEINGRLRTGLGFYITNKPVHATNQIWNKHPDQLFASATRFYYFAFFAEYVALRKKHFEIALPNYIGYGWANEKFYAIPSADYMGKQRERLWLLEVSMLVTYRACRWVGIGVGFGYRGILNKNPLLKASYNGPITLFRLKCYLIEFYRTFEKKYRANKGLAPKLY